MTKLLEQVTEKEEFYRDNGDFAVMEIAGFASIIDEAYRLMSDTYDKDKFETWMDMYEKMIEMGESVKEDQGL